MIIRNEDIKSLTAEIPDGHKHLRATIVLKDGSEITMMEAAVANLVRAYITVKTHPVISRVRMKNKRLVARKNGYAESQLVEHK